MDTPASDDPITEAREWLASAGSVAVLTGAGISAESGVPTYRGAGGLWRDFSAKDVASPEAFQHDPSGVWQWHNDRRMALEAARPNAGHLALAELERRLTGRGGRFDLVTQNIDGLHQAAGSRNVWELHGTMLAVRCSGCDARRPIGFEVLPEVPTCSACGSLMRPAIVWFGEVLPQDVWLAALDAVTAAEVFLTVGTSAVVYPAAGLVELAVAGGAKTVEVNLEPTAASRLVHISLQGKAGDLLPQLVP